jgi:hypothetical protein
MDEFVDEFDRIGQTLTTWMEFTSSMELNGI